VAQALYRKWRSQTFEEVIGQEHVAITLRNALRDGRLSHAYLFTGVRGTGKTSLARILAKAINCLDPDPAARPCNRCAICTAITEGRQLDLIEIDAASNRGIDEIRDLREKIGFRPNEARYKVYVIDEVHMLTREAFNALLKTLEEPPPHAVFVLATTEPDRVPETVRSRCQRFDFRRIPTAEIVEHLTAILAAEGKKADSEALVTIARRATGSMRDAISLLDQLLSYGDEVLSLARVENVLGLVDGQEISRLMDHLVAKDAAAGLALINRLVADGVELGQLADQIVVYLRAVLFLQVARAPELLDLPQEIVAAAVRQANALTPGAALVTLREFVEARAALRDQVPGVPQLPLELAFLRAALPASASAGSVEIVAQSPGHTRTPPTTAPISTPSPPARPAPPRSAPTTPARPAADRPTSEARPVVSRPAVEPAPPFTEPPSDAALLKAAQATWERFLLMTGKRCGMKVQAALRSVRGMDVAGQAIVLQFSHAFARDLVNQGENRSQVEALWSELLGRPVQVRGRLVGESQTPVGQPPAVPENAEDAFLRGARELGAMIKQLD
jgi:DNA polymerase-3 subunit gamma/tau